MICGPGPVLYLLLAFVLNINQAGLVTTQLTGDVRHKVKMGEKNVACDDGATNLAVDWLDSPLNYTCYHPTTPLLPSTLETVVKCEDLAEDYFPQHFCMTDALSYDARIPTHGDHRPIWPKFGEYR